MRTTSLLGMLACLLLSLQLFGQSSYKRGSVTTLAGDSVTGYIDYRQWEINPKSIRFKPSLETSTPVTYGVNDISAFHVYGSDRYLRAVVKKDMRPVELNELLKQVQVADTTETVFLRSLVESTISLLELVDTKPHFYIRDEQGAYHELLYKVYLVDGDSRLSRSYIFRDQLNQWIPAEKKTGLLKRSIETAEYQERDLVRIMQQITASGGGIRYQSEKSRQPATFFIGAGAVLTRLKIGGTSETPIRKLTYTSKTSPVLTAGVDVAVARNLQRALIRFGIDYYQLDYEGSNRSKDPLITYKVKFSSIMPSISVLYNLLNEKDHKFYLGLGAGYNITNYKENTLETTNQYATPSYVKKEDYASVSKGWMLIDAKAGYIFFKRFELAATYKIGGSFVNMAAVDFQYPLSRVSFAYRF